MKKILTTLALSSSIFLGSYANATKIGYVNVDALLSTLPQIQQASIDIKAQFEPRELALIESSKSFQKRVEKFKKNKDTMLESKAKKEIEILVNLEQELQSKSTQLKKDIRSKNESVLKVVQIQINEAINLFAKKEKYDIILYQKIAYVSDDIDITKAISIQLKLSEK